MESAMPVTINFSIEIDASSETVWHVIADLKRYGDWNKFVVACDSSLQVGDPIKMQVRVLPFMVQPQTETIFEHVPGQKLSYGINMPLGALESHREHVLKDMGDGRTLYQSNFQLSGWVSPIVGFLMGAQLRRGFSDMSYGIKDRALALAKVPLQEESLSVVD
jgi:uncharacterized protein YndB with AHSA1/START domain